MRTKKAENRGKEEPVKGKREGVEEEGVEDVWEEGSVQFWEDVRYSLKKMWDTTGLLKFPRKKLTHRLCHTPGKHRDMGYPSCRGCVIYLCVLRTQCPCHTLGIQYTLIEFDLIKVVNDLD